MQRLFFTSVIILFISLIPFLSINTSYIYAATLDEEAASYRQKGYEAQEKGDIDTAITWYQKAVGLDPSYAAPHNDLGILFEAKGWLDRAEAEYQKAIAIDPGYEKAHTNLALLYERKGELEKAAFHWMRRYRLGKPDDPWTYEARRRLERLGLLEKTDRRKIKRRRPRSERETYYKKPEVKKQKQAKPSGWARVGPRRPREEAENKPVVKRRKPLKPSTAKRRDLDRELQESLRLAEERLREEKAKGSRISKKRISSPGAQSYYREASDYYERGEYARALDKIRSAKKDYPDDPSLLDLEKAIKNQMKEERIKDHYNEGIMRYQQQDFSGARKEFEAILNTLPE